MYLSYDLLDLFGAFMVDSFADEFEKSQFTVSPFKNFGVILIESVIRV
jgi:hypothetical protein